MYLYGYKSVAESLCTMIGDQGISLWVVLLSFVTIISPQEGGLIIWPSSLRPSIRGQWFLRSVWVNRYETLGQEQVRSED